MFLTDGGIDFPDPAWTFSRFHLRRGVDFVRGMDAIAPTTFPVGIVVALRFNDPGQTVWTAVVTATTVDWNVDKAIVNTLWDALAAVPNPTVLMTYTDGAIDLAWATGVVTLLAEAAPGA